MFRGWKVRSSRRDRVLAVVLALGLHALVIALAVTMAEGVHPADVKRVEMPGFIRFVLTPWRPVAPAGPGVGTRTARREKRHAVPKDATYVPHVDPILVEEAKDARTIHPNMPAVVVQGTPAEAHGHDEAADFGDAGRRGPRLGDLSWSRFGVSGVIVTQPSPSRFCVPRTPSMPEAARLAGITGSVHAVYVVDDEGVVRGIAAEGHPLLAEAVRQWLRGCLFEPSLQNGVRAAARVEQSFEFVLR